MPKKVNIITLGCSKNVVDSEKLIRQLAFNGYEVEFDNVSGKSDILIINTCGFINDAREESVNTILEGIRLQKKGAIRKLYVMGCLSEIYKGELQSEIPEVDRYFGVNDIRPILEELEASYREELVSERVLSGPGHYAYLKISEGCDRKCAFCAIPAIRGKYLSRPVEKLVDEAVKLATEGVKELILIAQDLSYYGLDLYGEQKLVELVERLAAIDKLEWIRLHYLYPANFPAGILDLMAREPKICRYIDLPVQHITDNMLKLMRRSHSSDETRRLLDKIRKQQPDAAVRTTLITGHPGETKEDFRQLLSFVKEYRFERLGVFTYSHEEHTYSFSNYRDDIPEKVKRERADAIMAAQQEIALEKNLSMVGKKINVIIDRREGCYLIGRSEFDSPEVDQEVIISAGDEEINPGDFIDVTITSAREFDLEAEISK